MVNRPKGGKVEIVEERRLIQAVARGNALLSEAHVSHVTKERSMVVPGRSTYP